MQEMQHNMDTFFSKIRVSKYHGDALN